MKILWVSILVLCGCSNKHINLNNTKWRLKKWSIDEYNYLTPLDKKAIGQFTQFADSLKLYMEFKDTSVFTYVENGGADTSNYEIKNDTLFFKHSGNYNDTDIIVKISNDSLIMHSLAGSRTFHVRQK